MSIKKSPRHMNMGWHECWRNSSRNSHKMQNHIHVTYPYLESEWIHILLSPYYKWIILKLMGLISVKQRGQHFKKIFATFGFAKKIAWHAWQRREWPSYKSHLWASSLSSQKIIRLTSGLASSDVAPFFVAWYLAAGSEELSTQRCWSLTKTDFWTQNNDQKS